MTLEEKVGQMTQIANYVLFPTNDATFGGATSNISQYFLGSVLSGGGGFPLAGNTPEFWADMVDEYQNEALTTRLQIPLIYGVDTVHGHGNLYGATIFPHNIGLGATRDPSLVRDIGEASAAETKATGIPWTFAPCLAVARDERWGRTYESYGEDPQLVSDMASALIDGLQNPRNAKSEVAACAKHWVGDGGTQNGIDQGNTISTLQELEEIHVKPYFSALELNVKTIMISYSSFNGLKMHANKDLNTIRLKEELGFSGFIIGDWAAHEQTNCEVTGHPHCTGADYCRGVELTINSGVDMGMVPDRMFQWTQCLIGLVLNGTVANSRIDDAVSRILKVKMELGLFEAPFAEKDLISTIYSDAHREIAKTAVRKSLVLLKNYAPGLLPLRKNQTIVVVGKAANDIGIQCGGWTKEWQGEIGNITKGTTIYQGIRDYVPNSVVELNEDATIPITKHSDAVAIVVVGETPYSEWFGDVPNAMNLTLTADDNRAILETCEAMPCVVIVISGRPLIITDVINNHNVNAVVAAWLPGSEAGAMAGVLFGDYNFTGKLPHTWPASYSQIPINVGDGKEGLFPYGFGMQFGEYDPSPSDPSPSGDKVTNEISRFLMVVMFLLTIYCYETIAF